MDGLQMTIGGLITFVLIVMLAFAFQLGHDIGKEKVYQDAIERNCGDYTSTNKFKWHTKP